MRDRKDEHIDPYKSVRILGQKIEPEASFAKGATLETLEIITAIRRLVDTDSSKKREKLFEKLADEASHIKDRNNPFAIGIYIAAVLGWLFSQRDWSGIVVSQKK